MIRLSEIAEVIRNRGHRRLNYINYETGGVCLIGAAFLVENGLENAPVEDLPYSRLSGWVHSRPTTYFHELANRLKLVDQRDGWIALTAWSDTTSTERLLGWLDELDAWEQEQRRQTSPT